MMNKITLVTPPDDISQDGLRILCVSLTPDQDQVVSQAITKQSDLPNTIIYVWKNGEPLEWLFDKKLKSNIIIFNGCSDSGEINGYLAAQPNSYYFGPVKNLILVNDRDIYDVETCFEIIKNYIDIYGKKFI